MIVYVLGLAQTSPVQAVQGLLAPEPSTCKAIDLADIAARDLIARMIESPPLASLRLMFSKAVVALF